jgi:hypothetical protein
MIGLSTKRRAIETLLRRGRTDLVAAVQCIEAANQFDVECAQWGCALERGDASLIVDVFGPLEHVGRRGKRVEHHRYHLMLSADDHTPWDSRVRQALKSTMTIEQALTTIRSILLDAEKSSMERGDFYPSKLYGPHRWQLKGVDPRIPDPKYVSAPEGRHGRDISIDFDKPLVSIVSLSDSRAAQRRFESIKISIKWAHAPRVSRIIDELLKLRGLEAVEEVLKCRNIPYRVDRTIDNLHVREGVST